MNASKSNPNLTRSKSFQKGPKSNTEASVLSKDMDYKTKVPPPEYSESMQRRWLKKHGKSKYIDFDDEERRRLRKYFISLDTDGSNAIGVQELEEPLIALGLVTSREEVVKLMQEVDRDGTGEIEFDEFLKIMSSIKKANSDQILYEFFKRMIRGELMENMDTNLPFRLNLSQYRRRKLLDAICETDDRQEQGKKILQAFKRQLIMNRQETKKNSGDNQNDNSLDMPPNNEIGVNTRNGFPKYPKIMQTSSNLLIKPKSIPIKSTKP